MRTVLLIAAVLAGCAQLPPTPADIQAKRFEVPPGKAVIYVVRTLLDSRESSGLVLEKGGLVMTLPGTYYRWEVDPGMHRVDGFGVGTESVTLQAVAGQIYFLEHTVVGDRRSGPQLTWLERIGDAEGRALVEKSELRP